ncbi:hypothetical protein Goshw_015875 [Gossypium schwendimanii]|uniref:Agenet domain-containing protein n=1 Tax=Gossypium schwendimanii TaxID=34291 RepID=A0A7J9L3M3_GOSSC|nr:hypothetical protein [Gossypium schwendimanii]
MVNSPAENDPLQQQQPLSKGAAVEVSSDEEGFRGAWYLATILEMPPKSASKKRKKAFVRYKTLLADDGKSPLTEHVDPGYIRPLPPNEKGNAQSGFEVNDVVDARYRDGWWTGVVRKVLAKSKYRVYFDNPPDVIEFDRKDLRVHWDWIDGNWVRPEKHVWQSTGSVFSSGTAVEVNVDDENLRDVWFPAIVVKENEDKTFLVKYQNSKNDDESGTAKVVVDSLHIRPTPPRYADRNYELLERVDTTYNFGWRTGVITKVLTGRRYNVFFKHGNEDKELSHSDIRPNVEWTDGNWISKSKEVIIASDDQELIGDALCGTRNTKVAGELESSLSTKENTEDKIPLKKMKRNATEQPTPTDENSTLHSGKKKVKLETSNGNTFNSRSSKKQTEGNAVVTPISVTGDQLKDIPSETLCKEGNPRTGGKATKFPKKTVIADQPCAKSESPLTEATTLSPLNGLFQGLSNLVFQLGYSMCPLALQQTASNDRLFCQHHRSNWTTKRQKVGSADGKVDNLAKRNVKVRKSPSNSPQVLTAGKEGTTRVAGEINEGDIKTKEVEMPIILGLAAKVSKTLQAENSCQIPSEEPGKLMGDQKNNLNDSVRNENMEIMENNVGESDPKKKRGRPRKAVVTSPKAFHAGKEQNGAGGITDEKVLKDCTSDEAGLSKHKGVELSGTWGVSVLGLSLRIDLGRGAYERRRYFCSTCAGERRVMLRRKFMVTRLIVCELTILFVKCITSEDFTGRINDDQKTREVHLATAGISDMNEDDQPLSTWIGGIHSSGDEESRLSSGRLVNGWNEEKGLVDVPIESHAIDATGRSPLDSDQSLPFVKKSPIWRTIESLDVFQIVPQKPHFQPLAESREEFREGSAIGIMVTFASLFDKISMLHFDDPRNTFDSISEGLDDLEKHGFDVSLLRRRVNKLLSIKEGHSQHLGEKENAEREIMENTKWITKFDEEMEEIEKKIAQLQEQHSSIKSEKETKSLKVGSLKLHADVLNKLIQNAPNEFKKTATASWKLP